MRVMWQRGRRPSGPIFVAGFFGSASGIGQAARLFAAALESAGIEVRRIDVGNHFGQPSCLTVVGQRRRGAGVIVSFLNPPELVRWLGRGGALALHGKRHIGYWFWELPVAPAVWTKALSFVDEVWCQSHYTAASLGVALPKGAHLVVSPHPVFSIGQPQADRARFGLPASTCVVLSMFDLRSTSARKNPLGVLAAYEAAVPECDPSRAMLVLKMRSATVEPDVAAKVRAAAARRADVSVFEDDLSSTDTACLLASCDVAVSLHRAEGFGLVPAEAAWLGKAVLATGWSGVTDFLNDDIASLVAYRLVPVDDSQGIYSGGLWAEPDLEDAALRLTALIAQPELRRALGERARSAMRIRFDENAWTAAAFGRLGFIQRKPVTSHP
jgi:glycosyltransferase involved in cell wall biosynthesis